MKRLILDSLCEIKHLMLPWATEEFWDFSKLDLTPGSVIVLGRQHLLDNLDTIKELAETGQYVFVFDNSAEGSWTCETQIQRLHIDRLIADKKILVVCGGSISDSYAHITHEYFLPRILDFEENLQAQQATSQIFSKTHKPHTFLFLNGRARPHRKYLFERFKRTGALDNSLWTMLDAMPCVWRSFQLRENGIDIMATPSPLQHLPTQYEVPRYRNPKFGLVVPDRTNLKQELFDREWGEIYLEPAPYIDTYFSVVTETVCAESRLSFRTEKTAKPLAMGHPFIVASNTGFYRDLHNLGFQTFNHVIDESFDQIDNHQDRMNRIVDIVTDLCQQDLASFLQECYNVCKYNQQHLAELQFKERQEFPERFFQFLKENTIL